MQITVAALVLKTTAVGEYDKMITLLTREYGRISVSAKGSKNLKSRLLSGTQTFSYGNFTLYSSKGKYSLNDVELLESFFDIRSDIAAFALAGYICDTAYELAPENQDSGTLLPLVLNALHLVSKKLRPLELVKAVFELRAYSVQGFAPNLVACGECAVYEHPKMYLSVSDGQLICDDCYRKMSEKPLDAVLLSPSVLYAMRYIVFSDDKKIFSFKMEEAELRELSEICEKYALTHCGHGYKTLEFYNTVKE